MQTAYITEDGIAAYIAQLETAVRVSSHGMEVTDFWCIELPLDTTDTNYAYLYVAATPTAVEDLSGDVTDTTVASVQVEAWTEPGQPWVAVFDHIPTPAEVAAVLQQQPPTAPIVDYGRCPACGHPFSGDERWLVDGQLVCVFCV